MWRRSTVDGASDRTARFIANSRSLSSGQGYSFGEFGAGHAYPGLPFLLAGINRLFGENIFRPALAQFLIVVMALLTTSITYRLMRLHFPEWMAVVIGCGVATNARFLELSNELLTDVPFLLGMMTALYGWEQLRIAGADGIGVSRHRARAISLLVAGLLLAAVMRPTFWVWRWPGESPALGGLLSDLDVFTRSAWSLFFLVWVAFASLDPRTQGFSPLSGGYEREAMSIISDSSSLDPDSRAIAVSTAS